MSCCPSWPSWSQRWSSWRPRWPTCRPRESKYKSVATAPLEALCNEMRGAGESIQSMPLESSTTQQSRPQNLPKSRPRLTLDAKKASKRRHRPAKRCPREPQTRPRASKKRPRRAKRRSRAFKSQPRATQESHRPFQNEARQLQRPVCSTILVESFVRQAPRPI